MVVFENITTEMSGSVLCLCWEQSVFVFFWGSFILKMPIIKHKQSLLRSLPLPSGNIFAGTDQQPEDICVWCVSLSPNMTDLRTKSEFCLFRSRHRARPSLLRAWRGAGAHLWCWPRLPPPLHLPLLEPGLGHPQDTVRHQQALAQTLWHFLFQTWGRGPDEDHGEEGLCLLGVGHHHHPCLAPAPLHHPLLQAEPPRWLLPPHHQESRSSLAFIAGTEVVLTESSVFFIEELHLGPKARKAQMWN